MVFSGYSSIANLPSFGLFFAVALILVAMYMAIYTYSTAHDEFQQIRNNNPAAAVALGLSLLGFCLPLSSAIVNSTTVVDLAVWGAVALTTQILAYWVVRIVLPNLSERIASGEIAAALFLGAASLAAGLMTAATMVF
jgi:putative membrane protein